jgi:hypothetical protein
MASIWYEWQFVCGGYGLVDGFSFAPLGLRGYGWFCFPGAYAPFGFAQGRLSGYALFRPVGAYIFLWDAFSQGVALGFIVFAPVRLCSGLALWGFGIFFFFNSNPRTRPGVKHSFVCRGVGADLCCLCYWCEEVLDFFY